MRERVLIVLDLVGHFVGAVLVGREVFRQERPASLDGEDDGLGKLLIF